MPQTSGVWPDFSFHIAGMVVFAFLTLWAFIVVLPTNIAGVRQSALFAPAMT